MQQANFKTVNTWEELSDLDKAFLETWLIYRHNLSENVTQQHYADALEHYNEVGVSIHSGKTYEIGFDGGYVESWWECTDSDEELLQTLNDADENFGGGVFDSIEEFKQLGEYIQTSDYLGVFVA